MIRALIDHLTDSSLARVETRPKRHVVTRAELAWCLVQFAVLLIVCTWTAYGCGMATMTQAVVNADATAEYRAELLDTAIGHLNALAFDATYALHVVEDTDSLLARRLRQEVPYFASGGLELIQADDGGGS